MSGYAGSTVYRQAGACPLRIDVPNFNALLFVFTDMLLLLIAWYLGVPKLSLKCLH